MNLCFKGYFSKTREVFLIQDEFFRKIAPKLSNIFKSILKLERPLSNYENLSKTK